MDMLVSEPLTNLQIYAIIVNWNRHSDTLVCIESLLGQISIFLKVVVVDNGSADDSVNLIKKHYPQVTVIANSENLGFGIGNNIGINYALENGADYVFLINNDAILAPNAMVKMLMHTSSDIGIIAPIIYYATPPDLIWSIGGKINPWILEVSNNLTARFDIEILPEIMEQDFVTGCGMLISRSILEVVGGFDERFKMYYEDSDLCLRIRKAGYKIMVVTSAKMWHKVASSSGGKYSPNERYWMGHSSVQFFRKHGEGWQFLLIIPYRLGSAVKTTLKLLLKGKRSAAKSYWQGLYDGFRA